MLDEVYKECWSKLYLMSAVNTWTSESHKDIGSPLGSSQACKYRT